MKETQHQKIIDLCQSGQWICGNTFRENYIFSFHKRMIELEGRKNKQETPTGKYIFKYQPCEHGSKNVRDYLMVENEIHKLELKKKVVFIEGRPTLLVV